MLKKTIMTTSTIDTIKTTTTVQSSRNTSPAMTRFLSTQKSGGNIKKGYYSNMSFLDSQEAFNLTFGESPAILPSSPTSTKSEYCYIMIHEYSDLCKLLIFCIYAN